MKLALALMGLLAVGDQGQPGKVDLSYDGRHWTIVRVLPQGTTWVAIPLHDTTGVPFMMRVTFPVMACETRAE